MTLSLRRIGIEVSNNHVSNGVTYSKYTEKPLSIIQRSVFYRNGNSCRFNHQLSNFSILRNNSQNCIKQGLVYRGANNSKLKNKIEFHVPYKTVKLLTVQGTSGAHWRKTEHCHKL